MIYVRNQHIGEMGVTARAVSAALTPPNCGGALSQGSKIPVPLLLSISEKASIPKLKYEALEISEVRGTLKEKCITVTLGPFESKVAHLYIAVVAVGPL